MTDPTIAEESCGAIVWAIKKGTPRVLVLRRSDEETVWEPPKGHRQEGESERQAASRELKEELGIINPSFHPSFREVLEYKNSKGILMRYILFLVHAERITLSPEHAAHKWVTVEKLGSYFKYDDIKKIYERAFQIVQRMGVKA